MGIYVDKDMPGSKREWVQANKMHYTPVDIYELQNWEFGPDNPQALLAYMSNGAFDCIAFAFNKTEFKRLRTGRPDVLFFSMPKEFIRQHVHGGDKMKELK